MGAQTMDQIRAQAEAWLSDAYDEETRKKVQYLLDNDPQELKESFYTNVAFGTGGMRGIMGVGTNRINKYTIGKATQGLAETLKESHGDNIAVAIAHDCRNNSDVFARVAANVLSANGIKVFLFKALRPTPELSFAVRHYACKAGIVVTASHNPKEYNGYKVYGDDGCQIVSPVDQILLDKVKAMSVSDVNFEANEALIESLGEETDAIYIDRLKTLSLSPEAIARQKNTKIVYTALHGTGAILVPRALKAYGFENVSTVAAQDEISGDFPTVISPNPEEPAALEMAIAQAGKIEAELVMGTDPDSDRVGIAIRMEDGTYQLLNGNQTGSLLVYYLITRWKELGKITGKEFIAKTVVTTELMDKMALANGIKVYNTLTGFKHIGSVIRNLEGKEQFIGGGEESYGYLAGDFVRDKDAVMSCALIAEMFAWAKDQGKSLPDLMADMHLSYGFYLEDLISLTRKGMDGAAEIAAMVENFRNNPPSEINGSKVVRMIDYKSGDDKNMLDGSISNIDLPSSNFMQFFTEDDSKITVRPSGTEPKIKFYFSVNTKLSSKELYTETEAKLKEKIKSIQKSLQLI